MDQASTKKPGRAPLGRGLAAMVSWSPVSVKDQLPGATQTDKAQTAPNVVLFNKTTAEPTTGNQSGVRFVAISEVFANPKQPRRHFDPTEVAELAESIKALGVLQPVLVRPVGSDGRFEIVAGERRFRASGLAGLKAIPVIVKELTDREALEIALVENVQRSNLSPLEEAHGYKRLADEFSLTQKEIAERVGKDRASVANFLRLLTLPEPVLELLQKEQISMGHAKAILTVKEPSAQINLARKVVAEQLSVRALEAIVSRVVVLERPNKNATNAESASDSGTRSSFPEVTDRLRAKLGTKVVIRHHESGRGKIELEYFSEAELARLVDLIGV